MRKGSIGGRTDSGSGGVRAADKRTHRAKEWAVEEIKKFLLIAVYLWILLTLFVLQETLILARANIDQNFTPFGFAIINALILAKVVLIAEDLHFAQRLDDWPLIYPTLYKSVAFGILCIAFYILEEVLVGLWQGKVVAESLPPIARQGIKGIVLAATTLTVEFIPLFAVRELGRVLGGRQLRTLFFARRSVGG